MPRKKTVTQPPESDDCKTDADSCTEINEGIPTKPLPKEGLPQFKEMQPDPDLEDAKAKGEGKKKRRDGMETALEILDEYYDETPKRDIRFHHDEE
ncbi:TPA: hypothetical protein HA251_04620 [Candidatus Woesearchaeota archaeon]|nr:hypothetical protein [Candidatus Woesearchaeota archaeon]